MVTIEHLPSEMISMILQYNDSRDIINFGSTSKRFNEMVNCDNCLWKMKFKFLLPDFFKTVDEHGDGDWLGEMKFFFTFKQQVYAEVISMSPTYYWRNAGINFNELDNFLDLAMTNNMTYYYTIYILQDAIMKSRRYVNAQRRRKPFTLTEAHYAKIALRPLLHSYLAVKWVKIHVKDELTPEIVINFFLQWIDPDTIHTDEAVENAIMGVVKSVQTLLGMNPTKACPATSRNQPKRPPSERNMLAAVTQVLYIQMRMSMTTSVNLDTLNVVKAIDTRCGNLIVLAAVYQAVAKRVGVNCELIAFPNHLYLEWHDKSSSQAAQVYNIDLTTGELHLKRQCPFAQGSQYNSHKYHPDSLLQYIYSTFHMHMGAIKNWNTQNALHLLDFLGTYDNPTNPYKNFLPQLLDFTHLPAMNTPLNLKYLSDGHQQIIKSLMHLNTTYTHTKRSVVVKTRDSRIKFAVGMICYHKTYDYVCIIQSWDYICAVERPRRLESDTLEFGPNQPFYHVIALDSSVRYVAQENIVEKPDPSRLYYLEDVISREFTHFDGFSYVPNDEKRKEYPQDIAIAEFFRNMWESKARRPSNVK